MAKNISELILILESKTPESSILDYKQEIPKNFHELTKDIMAFANNEGGIIFFGVAESREDGKKTGVPGSIEGIIPEKGGIDGLKEQISNSIRGNIEPPPRIKIESFEYQEKILLSIEIEQQKHLQPFLKKGQIHIRDNSGTRSLSREEALTMAIRNHLKEKEIENFIDFRIKLLGKTTERDQFPVVLQNLPLMTIHVVPEKLLNFPLEEITIEHLSSIFSFHATNGPFFNSKGVSLSHRNNAYRTFFRNGISESTRVLPVFHNLSKTISIEDIESEIAKEVEHIISIFNTLLKEENISFFSVYASFTNVLETKIKRPYAEAIQENSFTSHPSRVSAQHTKEKNLLDLQNIFNFIWQAYGFKGKP